MREADYYDPFDLLSSKGRVHTEEEMTDIEKTEQQISWDIYKTLKHAQDKWESL